MRSFLVFTAVLGISFILQIGMISRITLLSGNGDLILVILAAWSLQEHVSRSWVWGLAVGLIIGGVSAAPMLVIIFSYVIITLMGGLLTHRIWQAPLLAMFTLTVIGTLIVTTTTYLYRILNDSIVLHPGDFIQTILPTILINLLLAIAIHPLIHELCLWLYPTESTV